MTPDPRAEALAEALQRAAPYGQHFAFCAKQPDLGRICRCGWRDTVASVNAALAGYRKEVLPSRAALPEGWPLTPEQQAALADGRALEKLPTEEYWSLERHPRAPGSGLRFSVGIGLAHKRVSHGPTIAAAVSAAIEALEGREG